MFDQPKQDSFAEIFLGNEYASYSDENLCRSGEMGDIAFVAASKWGQGSVVCKRDKG